MDKKEKEKITNLAKNYLKQKTLKDKLKFVEENPITEEKEKFNFFRFIWRNSIGRILILLSILLVSSISGKLTSDYQNGFFLIPIPLYLYLLYKSLDWMD